MRARALAFTLSELLTVLAILLVLAGLLFPVFHAARDSANKSVCLSNFRQTTLAATLYLADYDEGFMPASYRPTAIAAPRNDRTWVQLLLPYERSFSLFRCPSDKNPRPQLEGTFDRDLVPGDTDSRYYWASQRSNLGYNYVYLSPIIRAPNGTWEAHPRLASAVVDPSRTILYVGSVWDRDRYGVPIGGGNYLVIPPCRYINVRGQRVDTFGLQEFGGEIYTANDGWDVGSEVSGRVYGGAWPWHTGRMNVARLDGSVRSMTPGQLGVGCNVAENWSGLITSPASYPWDLR